MRVRLLVAAGVLSFVPAFVRAQGVPAAVPVQAAPAPTAAHREGSFEFSFGGGFSVVDRAFNSYLSRSATRIANPNPGALMMGGQLRATVHLSPHLGLGAGAGMTNGNGALLIAPIGALTYTFDLNRKFSPFIDLGVGFTRVAAYTGGLLGDAAHRATSTFSGFGGVGFRSMIGASLALRVEGRMSYDRFSEIPNAAFNSAAFVGLSLFVGGGRSRDTDGDGVPDKSDACPTTPANAPVDARGCTRDTDGDGVADHLDFCSNSPAGVPVDANGCPRDSDNDGVTNALDRCPNTPADARPVDATGCPVDTDGDGVADFLDRCPSTPAGVRVDATGCLRDSDNDGVTDVQDRCPNTPANARPVDATGCPVDTDRDAVADYLDRCANTAPGTQVDANGCPVQRDADSDGVIDLNDRCANTPPNTLVGADGCPLARLPVSGATLVIRNITFRANTGTLLPASYAALDKIALAILATPNSRWEVGGYTDTRGTRSANQRLSQARAQAVRQYLVRRNVPAASLTAVGYGSQRPVAPNTRAAGRAQNRRVEIKRLP
jgi:outer membrane protein OmpA-like peptidoglycan-associated protein